MKELSQRTVWQQASASAIQLVTTVGILFLTAGCTVDVVDPDSGQYQCETVRDCADGYYCSEAGQCIADGTPDPSDASDVSDSSDPSSTETPECGNGILDEGEACDDGALNSDSWSQDAHCNATCSGNAPHCGDGLKNGTEDCDTSGQDTVTCNAICTTSQCGDLYVNTVAGEACDDGNLDNTDACISCVTASCGDGFVQAGVEDCDDSNALTEACAYGEESCTVCNSTCQDGAGLTSLCGDGQLDAESGEVCDDGELNSDAYQLDGAIICNATCSGNAAYCGDNELNGPEECDDADSDNTDDCLNTCLDATCGDGFTRAGVEACDDGNESNQDNCLDTCVEASCGDGFTWIEGDGSETCDDNNTITEVCAYGADGCTVCNAQCQEVEGEASSCGDGVLQGGDGEVCDSDTVTCSSLGFGNGDVSCYANCSGYQPCPSTEKSVLGFTFEASLNDALGDDVSGGIQGTSINVNIADESTVVTNLIASFTVSAGATVKVGGVVQESGVTANDFSNPVTYIVTAEDGSELSYRVTVAVGVPIGFVLIEAGTFTMGSPESELGRFSDETQHQVTLTRDFYMMEHEVTQAQWQALMGNNPSGFTDCGGNCPVERVNWWEALHYANALSESEGLRPCYVMTGCGDAAVGEGRECTDVTLQGSQGLSVESPYLCEGYRLPTEAEWEYAARAGTTTAFYNGGISSTVLSDPNANQVAWYYHNAESTAHPVKGKLPNAWGLYDMSGNVAEWNWDWFDTYSGDVADPFGPSSGTYRVHRGGSWILYAKFARVASRDRSASVKRDDTHGFRVARTVNPDPSGAKELSNFQFRNTENDALDEDVSATIDGTAISAMLPSGTTLTSLIASFTVSAGATVKVGGVVQASGVTANDFSSPVTYVVTAEDGSELSYTVTVSAGVAAPEGFVLIEAGTFTMGSPEGELGRGSDETQHEVTLTNDFYLSDHEVTQAEWQALIGNNPSQMNNGTCSNCPIESVNWWEALHYANALSESEGLTACYVLSGCNGNAVGAGKECTGVTLQDGSGNTVTIPYECEGYRLPTEAEWEYAARAGTTTAFYNGNITSETGSDPNADAIAWYDQTSGSTTHPVKGKLPNAWDLYDMSGNVSEWVWDWKNAYSADVIDPAGPSSGSDRVTRGGCWLSDAGDVRVASRFLSDGPGRRIFYIGFRLARTAQ